MAFAQKIPLKVDPPKYDTDKVKLELSAGEARFLRLVLRQISGQPSSARAVADAIESALRLAGVAKLEWADVSNIISGTVDFTAHHEAFR